jgi:hypothetical protein
MGTTDLTKSTIIEGVASTSSRDSQGEVLDLAGADISPLLEGRGFVNSDHSGKFEHLVGRCLDSKKIYSIDDCSTPSQLKYWDQQRRPFLWTKLELWDGVDHKEADSIASIYKFYQNKNEEAPIKLSVEGKTLERGNNGVLKRTMIKGIALTVHPANRATRTEVTNIVKNAGGNEDLIKSEDEKVPIFIEQENQKPLIKLYSLAVTARDLLKKVSDVKAEKRQVDPIAKCRSALDKLRQMKEQLA